ncbi:MFS transporter [Alsobacter metallidurans]|uniref:MFS transporter n=1 Tax=Alsobacter metallidurans TaxID=340221 RepID=UPI001FCEB6D1|nr:MFS transporter [Alsobacter metallidurans]
MALSVAQAFSGAAITVLFATGAIVGATLAPEPGWATAPISIFVVGMALSTVPVGVTSRRWGRRPTLLLGTTLGVLSGALASSAILAASFRLFLLACFLNGFHAAVSLTYRFAATDGATDEFRPKAISYVLVAGVASAILGPQAVQHSFDLGPAPYVASYLAQGALALLALVAVAFFRAPLAPAASGAPPTPASALLRRPPYLLAVFCGLVAYTAMNMVMTAAPLAMTLCGHSNADANLGIQWHVLGMYAPSFVSGAMVSRFGARRMILAGLALLGSAIVVNLGGDELWRFWLGLAALGVGWNFAFVGATTLVVESLAPEERTRGQSLNDFIIFGAMAAGSLLSGGLLASGGWSTVNMVVAPALLAAFAALFSKAARSQQRRDGAAP